MKNVKRVAAFIVLFTLFFSCIATTSFAEIEQDNTEDVKYGVAINTLFRFGIISRENFEASEKVSRGEFVKKAMMLLGHTFEENAVTPYSDVSPEHSASGAIKAASDMKIVSGYGNGTFMPDKILQREEAVKIMVKLLGYEVYATSYGGYPGGYLTVATMEGLLKKVPVGDYQELTWGVSAQLLYNALDVDILQTYTYPEEKYFTNDGENVMTEYLKIFRAEGVVQANDVTSVTDGTPVKKGYIEIDGVIYKNDGVISEDMLGFTFEIYYRYDESVGDNILLFAEHRGDVEEIYVDGEDIDPASDKNSFRYFPQNSNNIKTKNIEEDAVFIYNGKKTDTVIYPENGKVRACDTDKNGSVDILFTDEYVTYVVESISANAGVICDMYGKENLKIDLTDSSLDFSVIKNSQPYDISKIERTNVLTVTKSRDNKFIKIVVSSKKIKDIVEEVTDETVTIAGETFPILKESREKFKELKSGVKTTIYFTDDEKAAAFGTFTLSGEKYAYIYEGEYKSEGVSENIASIRMFTQDGISATYETASNFQFEGRKNSAEGKRLSGQYLIENVLSEYNDATGTVTFKPQLVKVVINDEGKLVSMQRAVDNRIQAGGSGIDYDDFSIDYSFHTDYGENEYNTDYTGGGGTSYRRIQYKSMGFINNKYVVKNSIGMNIPSEESFKAFYSGEMGIDTFDKLFSIFKPSLWPDEKRIYWVDLYDVADDRQAKIVVQRPHQGGTTVSADAAEEEWFIVDKIVTAADDEGYPVKIIYGLYKGKEVSYPVDESAAAFELYKDRDLLDLKRGDVIRIALNPANEITNILQIFTLDASWSGGHWDYYILKGNRYDQWWARTDPKEFGADQALPTIIPGAKERVPSGQVSYYPSGKEGDKGGWNSSQVAIHAKYTKVIEGYNAEVSYGDSEGAPARRVICPGASNCRIYVYDEASDTVRIGSMADIDPANPAQTAVIRNRYSYALDTLLVNREKDPGTIYWFGDFK